VSVCLVCLVWSVPIEFPRRCFSVNPRNCTYAFPRRCISTFYTCIQWGNLCHRFEIIYLLKKADLSMWWALKSRGMSVECIVPGDYGKGDFLSYLYFLCSSPRCCVLLCEYFFLRMFCTIVLFPTYILYSFLILRILCWSTLRAYF